MKRLVLTLLSFALPVGVFCSAQDYLDMKHEIRLGLGDPLMEYVTYRDTPDGRLKDHTYMPHFFVEYDYTLRPWVSFGAQVDLGSFWWNQIADSGDVSKEECYNVAIMPQVRFNWLMLDKFTMFSTVRAGIDINTGTELDPRGRNTALGVAFSPTFVGCSYGSGHWFGSLEFGLHNAIKDKRTLFMVGSKILSISAGYRF